MWSGNTEVLSMLPDRIEIPTDFPFSQKLIQVLEREPGDREVSLKKKAEEKEKLNDLCIYCNLEDQNVTADLNLGVFKQMFCRIFIIFFKFFTVYSDKQDLP
jgi:hypothetical protein